MFCCLSIFLVYKIQETKKNNKDYMCKMKKTYFPEYSRNARKQKSIVSASLQDTLIFFK